MEASLNSPKTQNNPSLESTNAKNSNSSSYRCPKFFKFFGILLGFSLIGLGIYKYKLYPISDPINSVFGIMFILAELRLK